MSDDNDKGSRKIVGVKDGLLTSSHVQKMGAAIWTYLWLLNQANFETGLVAASSQRQLASQLVSDLGLSFGAARMHLQSLATEGYIQMDNGGLTITNYDSIATFFRHKRGGQNSSQGGQNSSHLEAESGQNSSHIIQYKRQNYKTLRALFGHVLDEIEQAKNPIAELRAFWVFLYGEDDTPDFGRLGKMAAKSAGATRPGAKLLALRALTSVGRQILGNVADYVEKMRGTEADRALVSKAEASKRPRRL